jgi:hypothetical protein
VVIVFRCLRCLRCLLFTSDLAIGLVVYSLSLISSSTNSCNCISALIILVLMNSSLSKKLISHLSMSLAQLPVSSKLCRSAGRDSFKSDILQLPRSHTTAPSLHNSFTDAIELLLLSIVILPFILLITRIDKTKWQLRIHLSLFHQQLPNPTYPLTT